MARITDKNLDAIVQRINRITSSPATYRDADRRIQVGHFHIDRAYGGCQLVQTTNAAGGVTNVLSSGFVTKQALADQMYAFICGLNYGNE